jgi:hypothetical protein
MFKIKNTKTGLFSKGGLHPAFAEGGKIFTKRGHVTSHLSQLGAARIKKYYTDCIVVEYELAEVEILDSVLDWRPLAATIRAKELSIERHKQYEIEYLKCRQARLEQELADVKKRTGEA